METDLVRIPTRSHRQAMDWSLVLVSQGIESTIDHSPEENRWGLLVGSGEHERAMAAIRQYRLENRGWHWRRQELRPGLIFDWGSVAWAFLVATFFLVDAEAGLRTPGYMSSVGVARGAWWRLFTAEWLHADLGHLATNAVLGTVLLGLAMGRYGTGVGLLAAYIAGAGGNLFAMAVSQTPHRSLGASGMVMGCLGLLATQSVWELRKSRHGVKWLLTGLVAGVMLFVLLGLAPDTDVLAHFGGFASGLLLGASLSLVEDLPQKTRVNLLAGMVFALLVILSWWFALR